MDRHNYVKVVVHGFKEVSAEEVSDVLRQFKSWDDVYRERVSSDGYVVRVGRSVFILPVGGDERYGNAR